MVILGSCDTTPSFEAGKISRELAGLGFGGRLLMPPPSLSCSPTRYLVPQGRTRLQNFTSGHKTSGKQYGPAATSGSCCYSALSELRSSTKPAFLPMFKEFKVSDEPHKKITERKYQDNPGTNE